MESISLKQYCQDNQIAQISAVRANQNGYPFLTLINKDKEADNIYFSKNAASKIELGQPANLFAKQLFIVQTQNEAGESRTKLSFNEYSDVDSMFD